MYGMINQAVKTMVLEKFNESTWGDICKKAEMESKDFATYDQYEDNTTLRLVLAICDVTGVSPARLLEEFGEFWIGYAKKNGYGSIIDSIASNPVEMIRSLDKLHLRLELLFTHLSPPVFRTEIINPTCIHLHYSSTRSLPLEPFVKGIITGVFKMYEKSCEVSILPGDKGEKAIFRVVYS